MINRIFSKFQLISQNSLLFFFTESTVKSSLVECLPHVAVLAQETPQAVLDNIIGRILNIVLIYLRDQDNQVKLWNHILGKLTFLDRFLKNYAKLDILTILSIVTMEFTMFWDEF